MALFPVRCAIWHGDQVNTFATPPHKRLPALDLVLKGRVGAGGAGESPGVTPACGMCPLLCHPKSAAYFKHIPHTELLRTWVLWLL